MRDVWRSVISTLVVFVLVAASPLEVLAISVTTSSLAFVSTEKTSYLPGEEVVLKAIRGTVFEASSSVSVSLSSANGGEFGGGNLSGTCSGGYVSTDTITIAAETNQKAFCYRNTNEGTDTITAVFTQGEVTEAVTFTLLIEAAPITPTITLNLASTSITDLEELNFSGDVITEEGGSKLVRTTVYADLSCEEESVNTTISPMVEDVEIDTDFTYSNSIGSLSAGDYSIQSELFEDMVEGETVATSECLTFEVTETVLVGEGSLTIEKRTEGYEGDWSFDFGGDAGYFTLTNDGASSERAVAPGEISVTEEGSDYWELSSVVCEINPTEVHFEAMPIFMPMAPEAPFESITVDPLVSFDEETSTFVVNVNEDESVYCIVTNTYVPPAYGFVTIDKRVENFDGDWSFDFLGIGDGFTISNQDEEEVMDKKKFRYGYEVPAGNVTITEVRQNNWEMTAVTCEYEYIYGKVEFDNETMEEVVVTSPLVITDLGKRTFTIDVPEDTFVSCVVTNTYDSENESSGTKVKGRGSSLPKAPSAPTVSLNTAAPSCQPLLTDYLRMGWTNDVEQVKKLQNFLNEYGFPVPVTGFFGPLTDKAVREFQAKYLVDVLDPWGIDEPTGFVYKTTRYKINNLVCPGSEAKPVL